jgi:formate dehydrogenase maturation protein FdhE
LALSTNTKRTLVCWRCDTQWKTAHRGCLGCGADGPPTVARVPSPYLGYELAICNSCGRYLKERRGPLTHELLVERTLTAGLDEAAQQRGLRA